MATKHDFTHLREFFEKSEQMGFFERLFSWGSFRSLQREAYAEFSAIDNERDRVNDELQKTNNKLQNLETKQEFTQEAKVKLEAEKKALENKIDELTNKVKEHEKELTGIRKLEEKKQQDYEHKVTELNSLKKQLDDDRIRVREEREQEIMNKHEKMKETWKVHQKGVSNLIHSICTENHVEYVDKVPFKGEPDKTIKICGEFIIFDAKSPQGDDLSNFPTYIKDQAEKAKKYTKEKDVKKEIFLVIPLNAADCISQVFYPFPEYNVHVITQNAIKPLIISLQKIEEYEFAEQLSPEDRQQVCRIIGRFAYAAKRRIQVDHFFHTETIEILTKCYDLPKEFLDGAIEAERTGKLNPPMDKRAKVISTDDLKKDIKRIKKEAEAKDIDTKADLRVIEAVPLYRKDE